MNITINTFNLEINTSWLVVQAFGHEFIAARGEFARDLGGMFHHSRLR